MFEHVADDRAYGSASRHRDFRALGAKRFDVRGLQIFDVFWQVSIQENVDEDKLARVYSFDQVGSFVARPIGLALAGPVAQAVGMEFVAV